MIHFFARHAGERARGEFQQIAAHHFVADHVEFFLIFALNVFAARQTEFPGNRGARYFGADRFGGFRNGEQEFLESFRKRVFRDFAGKVIVKSESHEVHPVIKEEINGN